MSDYMPVRERNYTRTLAKKRMRSMTATRAVRNPVCTVTENHRENQYDLVELKGGGRLTPYDTVYNVICHRKSSLPFPLQVHNIIGVSIHTAGFRAKYPYQIPNQRNSDHDVGQRRAGEPQYYDDFEFLELDKRREPIDCNGGSEPPDYQKSRRSID